MKKCFNCEKQVKNKNFCNIRCRRVYFNSTEFKNLEEELFGEYKRRMERMKREW